MIKTYVLGNLVRLSCYFTDSNGNAIDPSSVTLEVKKPDGVISTFTPTHTTTGNFYYDYLADIPGNHFYRASSSSGVIAAAQSQFVIADSTIQAAS